MFFYGFSTLTRISIFGKTLKFLTRFLFVDEILIFDQNFDFLLKFQYFSEMLTISMFPKISPQFQYFTENFWFCTNFNFCHQILVTKNMNLEFWSQLRFKLLTISIFSRNFTEIFGQIFPPKFCFLSKFLTPIQMLISNLNFIFFCENFFIVPTAKFIKK